MFSRPKILFLVFCKFNPYLLLKLLILNQARAGLRLVRTRFLEITFVQEVSMCVWMHACMCVCPSPGYEKYSCELKPE